jgi:hypothetical protein
VQLSCRAGVARAAGPSAAAAPFIPPSSRLDLDLNYDDPFGPFQTFSTPPCNPSQNSSERRRPRGWSASSERPPPRRPYLSLPRRRRQSPPSVRRPQRQPRQPAGPPRPPRVRAACQVTHPSATDPDRPALGRPDRARLAHRRTRPAASLSSRPARPRVRLALTAPPRFVLLTSMPPILLANCLSCLARVVTCRANRPSTTSFAQAPAAAASRVHGKPGKTSGDLIASFNQSPSDADEAGAWLPSPVRRLCLAEGAVSFTSKPPPPPQTGS